ncbi:lung adenoma susceptibility protein 2 isoform X3 [Pseudophryne corroboree]|uniref:lung adenoma susceptibility protein 2 isoform X3 n=1 Tax=Pseudophryne corroboree TaxID=495146 RepID=UPI003081256C
MEQSSSPDSSISISSLLASCSLSSHSGSSHSVGSIKYKDRLYDSASKALDAYIEDHEESLHSPIASPGKITIRPSPHHSSAKTRGHPNDLPDQNLEQAVEVSKKDSSQLPHNNGSPRTEDVLEAERSWENIPYSFKSPVPVLDEENRAPLKSSLVEDFLNDCAKKENKATTFSGGNHHGPVEALKHMLFNLQAFHQNFNQEKTPEKMDEKVSTEVKTEIQLVDQETFPVNKSLKKALHHLSRLKELVGDQNVKPNQENNQEIEV